MLFEEISCELIKKAISIYIEIAYNNKEINNPEVKKKVKDIFESNDKNAILSFFKLEIINNCPSYKLQIGSTNYPFMKLVIEKFFSTDHYGFYVDRHSEFLATDSNSPTFNKELAIKEETKELKLKIESEFEKNGIPTYRLLIKNYIKNSQNNIQNKLSQLNRTILLVEDDIDINEMHALELKLLGYNVDQVYDGYSAIKNIENKYYDLVLLDLMMAGISGQEVIKLLNKEVDIIVLSALNDEYTKNKCLKLGAKDYLVKPIPKKILAEKLELFFKKKYQVQ
ncbi:MAG: response regulator [Spirochaetes bacterium]|nr:response regulator [Spirochaetota bacterium]